MSAPGKMPRGPNPALLPIATAARTRRSVGALIRPHRLLLVATVLTLVAAAVAILAVPPLLVGSSTSRSAAGPAAPSTCWRWGSWPP